VGVSCCAVTYAFNLHGFAILDGSCEWNIWVPPVVQLWLLVRWGVQRDFTDVAHADFAHGGYGGSGLGNDIGAEETSSDYRKLKR
jgi:hypothetical protein